MDIKPISIIDLVFTSQTEHKKNSPRRPSRAKR